MPLNVHDRRISAANPAVPPASSPAGEGISAERPRSARVPEVPRLGHVDNLAKFDLLRRRLSAGSAPHPQAPAPAAHPEVLQVSGITYYANLPAPPYEELVPVVLNAEQLRRVPEFDAIVGDRELSAYRRPVAVVRNANVAHVFEYDELLRHWGHTRRSPFDGSMLVPSQMRRVVAAQALPTTAQL